MDENSNIALNLLKFGGDQCLFEEDSEGEIPANFMSTKALEKHLDSKCIVKGPKGHKNQMAYCNIEMLNGPPCDTNRPSNMVNLEKLAWKHKDLFDHPVISSMIW